MFGAERGITVKVSRILVEIFGGSKLGRIDKNRYDNSIGFLTCNINKREVAVMEKSHGWDKTDDFAGAFFCEGKLLQLFSCADDLHIETP